MIDPHYLKLQILDYGLFLESGCIDNHLDFVCGPANPYFYFDEADLKKDELKKASLDRLALEVFQRINPKQGIQLELFPFYSAIPTEKLAAIFLLKYKGN